METNPFATAEPWRVELCRDSDHAPLTRSVTGRRSSTLSTLSTPTRLRRVRGAWSTRRLPKIEDHDGAARALGMEPDEHGYAVCPLAGHDGIASLDAVGGELRLWCDCLGAELRWDGGGNAEHWYPLSDAYYSVRSGVVLDRANHRVAGRFAWRLLLLAAAGVVEPVSIELPPLPAGGSVELEEARKLFALVAGLRLALADCIRAEPLPMPFSEELVRRWCRLAGGIVPRQTIDGLVEHGVIEFCGQEAPRPDQRRGAFLYRPCAAVPWPGDRSEGESDDRDRSCA